MQKFKQFWVNRFKKLIKIKFLKIKFKTIKFRKPYYLCVGSSNWNSLFGCPDGCLNNLFNATKCIPKNKPIGLLLCEFSGALLRTGFLFNLNSIFAFAGLSWNLDMDVVNRLF